MRLSVLLSVLPLALAAPGVVKRESPAPLLAAESNAIAGKYIVKLREGSPLAALESAMNLLSGKASNVYENVFKGFAGRMDNAVVEMLRNHPDVCVYS